MAVNELLHFAQITASVTIDEAVELAKSFGEKDSPSFINGILDAVAREIPADRKAGHEPFGS